MGTGAPGTLQEIQELTRARLQEALSRDIDPCCHHPLLKRYGDVEIRGPSPVREANG